jgi:hypothetical protein
VRRLGSGVERRSVWGGTVVCFDAHTSRATLSSAIGLRIKGVDALFSRSAVTEKSQAFTVPMFTTADIPSPKPSWLFPPVNPDRAPVSPVATGVGGLIGGALLGAGLVASRKISEAAKKDNKEGRGRRGRSGCRQSQAGRGARNPHRSGRCSGATL